MESSIGPILVECGPHSTIKALEEGLNDSGYKLDDIQHVFLTHIHFDHAGSAWTFAERGATIYVHPRGVKHLVDPSKLYNSAKRLYGDLMDQLWGAIQPIAPQQLVAVEDKAEFQLGDLKLQAHYTPGHASHHIAWQLEDVIFTGDVAGCRMRNGPIMPPTPPPDIQIEEWKTSIKIMEELHPKALYLTHFGVIHDVDYHLQQLQLILDDWTSWMQEQYQLALPMPEVMLNFEKYLYHKLKDSGMDEATIQLYQAANPADLNAMGLYRYIDKFRSQT